MTYDFTVIGGGVVGLATAARLVAQYPNKQVLLLEKEDSWAAHQTGRNSGVIHSGIYYKPGSLKAKLAREGNRSIVEFCQRHSIAVDICGKLIVATEPAELPLLDRLYERGLANGLQVRRLSPEAAREIEPHVNCIAALQVPSTGIVSYRQVCSALAGEISAAGGRVELATKVTGFRDGASATTVQTTKGDFSSKYVVNCTGLHCDRIARKDPTAAGLGSLKIVPFRGEYYELRPDKRYLVKHLIYPVPNPDFPFLGVHFTRMIDGSIHAGPNAVLSLKREGYHRTSFDARDSFETLGFPGFWRLAAKHWKEGFQEVVRSFSKAAFVRSLQKLVPEIQEADVIPSAAGVRAQALKEDGQLVDDFLIVNGKRTIHVCNAPSPAATASLEIAANIVDRIRNLACVG
jgi:L-2-hydroxyglutarate oxidase